MKLKDLPKVEWPREKLEKYGPTKLSNSELLAVLLGTGKKGVNVVEFSRNILRKFGSYELPNATIEELKTTLGLGIAKASEIVACFELGRRLLQGKKSELYLTAKDAWQELKDIRNHKKEHFVIFFLDSRNQEIHREVISVGTLNANLIHPREVFEPAIRYFAAQIIVAHNHPSGNPEASKEDIEITKRLRTAGNILGIELLDHVIVAKNAYVSLKEKDLLKFDNAQ